MSETLKETTPEDISTIESREADSVPEFLEDPYKRIEIAKAIVNDPESIPRTGEELLGLIRATQIDVRTDEIKLMIASDLPTRVQRIDIVKLSDEIKEQWLAQSNGTMDGLISEAKVSPDEANFKVTSGANTEAATTPDKIIINVVNSFDEEKNVPRTHQDLLKLMKGTQIAVANAELAQMRSSDLPTTKQDEVKDMVEIANNIYTKGTNSLRDIEYLEKRRLETTGSNLERRDIVVGAQEKEAEKELNLQYANLLKEYFNESVEGLSPEDVKGKINEKTNVVIKKIFEDIKAKNIEEFGTDNGFNIYDEYEGELSLDRFPDRPDEYKKILDEAIDRKISI